MTATPKAYQTSETLTFSGNLTSTALDLRYSTFCSMQLTWTGLTGLAGTIVPQVSNDGSSWNDMESPYDDVLVTMDTAADTQVWLWFGGLARYVRLKYVANGNTTGTGTLLTEQDRK